MDEELKNASEEYCPDDAYPFGPRIINQIVREAFIAGAEWMEAHTPLPEDTILFNKGVAEGRRLESEDMMKEAVECELYYDGDFLAIDLNMAELGYSERDKVRIIVIPNTEEK